MHEHARRWSAPTGFSRFRWDLETILDVSGMPPLDALRILCELSQQRIISFR